MSSKTQISRTNRDRRGGHQPSYVMDAHKQVIHNDPKAKVFFKKLDKKRLRRESKRVIEEGVAHFNEYQSGYRSDYLDAYLDEQEWLDELSSRQEEEHLQFEEDVSYDLYAHDSFDEYWDPLSYSDIYSHRASQYHAKERIKDILIEVAAISDATTTQLLDQAVNLLESYL